MSKLVRIEGLGLPGAVLSKRRVSQGGQLVVGLLKSGFPALLSAELLKKNGRKSVLLPRGKF